MNIGLTTVKNFLINYKKPKCLAIAKDEFDKYSIMDVEDWHSFTNINMSPRFYKDNYYNKSNDEFSIPNYQKALISSGNCESSFEQYYITTEEPIFFVVENRGLNEFLSIYDSKRFIAKKPYFIIETYIKEESKTGLKLINHTTTKLNKVIDIYCLPKFNTDETKLLLEIGGNL